LIPFPSSIYDRLLWGERQIRSVANMTRSDARDFLKIAADIRLQPKVTVFSLGKANEALAAVKNDAIDGAAVIIPKNLCGGVQGLGLDRTG
jgi:propanol-preferring alcohol dehydrogenase